MHADWFKGVPPILLGSCSPRRRELLAQMGLECEVVGSGVEERLQPDAPTGPDLASYLAVRKLRAVLQNLSPGYVDHLILTADTVVLLGNARLDKPQTPDQAWEILRQLSGRTHLVATGVATHFHGREEILLAQTEVTFAELNPALIRAYIESGSPFDKAGAYGIQDPFGLLAVRGIRGSYTNVIGLPTADLHDFLVRNFSRGRESDC